MNYSVVISKRAQAEIEQLPNSLYRPLSVALKSLADNPRPQGYKKLVNREGYRLRIRDYRILYDIDDIGKVVSVYKIGPRRDIYRQ